MVLVQGLLLADLEALGLLGSQVVIVVLVAGHGCNRGFSSWGWAEQACLGRAYRGCERGFGWRGQRGTSIPHTATQRRGGANAGAAPMDSCLSRGCLGALQRTRLGLGTGRQAGRGRAGRLVDDAAGEGAEQGLAWTAHSPMWTPTSEQNIRQRYKRTPRKYPHAPRSQTLPCLPWPAVRDLGDRAVASRDFWAALRRFGDPGRKTLLCAGTSTRPIGASRGPRTRQIRQRTKWFPKRQHCQPGQVWGRRLGDGCSVILA